MYSLVDNNSGLLFRSNLLDKNIIFMDMLFFILMRKNEKKDGPYTMYEFYLDEWAVHEPKYDIVTLDRKMAFMVTIPSIDFFFFVLDF